MKHIIFTLSMIPLFVISCSSPQSNYEKSIADFVQTDRKGTKYDLKFKALDIKELQKITVSDSVQILKDEFDAKKKKVIENLQQSIDQNQKGISSQQNSRFKSQSMINWYQNQLNKDNQQLDSIQKTSFANPYLDKKADLVLAIIVECKYSIVPPIINTTAEETREFVLSPNGDKVYTRNRKK